MRIVLYALFGPLLGAVTFWSVTFLPHALVASFLGHASTEAWSAGLKFLSISMQYSYFVGCLPAIGAGICHVIARRKLASAKIRVLFVTLAGLSLMGILFVAASPPAGFYELAAPMIAAGGMAAFLMATAVEIFVAKRAIKAPGLS